MVRWTRGALGLSCAVGLGLTFYSYATSPDRVPVHYGLTGIPDRWGSPVELLVAYGCVIGIGSSLCLALPELLRRAPPWAINLPNKHYWLAPENRDAATAKFALWADTQGAAVNLLMSTLLLLLAPNANAAAVPAAFPAFVLVGFGMFTLASIGWLWLSYRLPTRP